MPRALRRLVLWSACAALAPLAQAETPITGTGATFPAKVYLQWAEDHTRLSQQAVKYLPAGSSAGVKAVSEGTVDFGASDVPLSAAELEKRGLFQFPTLVGGIVPFVNLPGVASGELRLDAATLARIWAGSIVRWNDSAIRALNPELDLPALPIQRVVRSDGSGTTTVFVQYLRQAAPEQAAAIEPDGGRARWPGSTIGADGSSKLVAAVRATPGAIGYASSDYTLRDRLTAVSLRNPRGEFVQPDLPAFRAAIVAGGLFKNGPHAQLLLPLVPAGRQGRGGHRLRAAAGGHPGPHREPADRLPDPRWRGGAGDRPGRPDSRTLTGAAKKKPAGGGFIEGPWGRCLEARSGVEPD